MIKKLLRLANLLDKEGHSLIADEVDSLIKSAVELTPNRLKDIEENVDKYFSDPEIMERNLIDEEYGLDEDDMFGLESTPWHGYKWSYEGFPKENAGDFKKFERYQTVILDNGEEAEAEFTDSDGTWELEALVGTPVGATKGTSQAVYRFAPTKELDRRKEPKEDFSKLREILDTPDDLEVTEEPEDMVEVKEEVASPSPSPSKKQHGGGVKLF